MTLIESHREWKAARQSEMVKKVREKLDRAIQLHLPGIDVWVYGSLVKPGRFSRHSDVDLALSGLPSGMTLEYLQSLLSRDLGREVDVCLLDKTRLKDSILREGELWIR
jgi:predicted nucleotidyltransferase